MREDRQNSEIRQIKMTPNFTPNADGSVLIECGMTKVICTATIEDKVPRFLKGKEMGWISAEYSMLPASTVIRKVRDISKGKIDGRNQEIQRLIGRSLRTCIDLKILGEKTIWLDCDVINADGGTRTTSINGSFIALELAIKKALADGKLENNPLISKVGAISVGKVNGIRLCDLDYKEDSKADVDLNIVMNQKFEIVEIQGTSERDTFTSEELFEFLDFAKIGIEDIFKYMEILEKYYEINFING
ncbi:ribonuclease PH [Peptoniphilus raoultii]|uniref:ribonuclease PH n=1 Tax=Peptoniphilus raoultii TaxID=1776387 RepID=UPI0008D9AE9E|nr:ribonuclease PH [Peptoniphilus raoultii]